MLRCDFLLSLLFSLPDWYPVSVRVVVDVLDGVLVAAFVSVHIDAVGLLAAFSIRTILASLLA